MSEEELVGLLERFETEFTSNILGILNSNSSTFYEELRRTREEIEKEHSDLENRAITAETKLKLYEAMFEKLNLNLELGKMKVDKE